MDSLKLNTSSRGEIIIGLIEHMGDIIACEPVSRYLRALYPQDNIIWAVSSSYRELIDNNPHIDETLIVDCLTDWIKITKHRSFKLIIDLHVNLRVCQHCRIPIFKTAGNTMVNAYEWFDYGGLLEAFSIGAGLPALTGHPLVYVNNAHRDAVNQLNLPDRFCAVHIESSSSDKDWLPEKWERLLRRVTNELGLPIVEVGGGRRRNDVALPKGAVSLFNQVSILQSAEVIQRAAVFIGVDSGPAHLANAAKKPAVVLLGRMGFFRSYNPYSGYFASGAHDVKLVRSLERPVRDISEQEVWEAVSYVARLPSRAKRELWEQAADAGPRGTFDAGWYAAQYEDVLASGMTPREHFLSIGSGQGRSSTPPSSGFHPAKSHGKNVSNAGAIGAAHRFWCGPTEALPKESPVAPNIGVPRTFAFYLPQFHPIPENDSAHGPGFSEWHNVVKARPLFTGHYQPRVPGELGYYDLRADVVLDKQIELARQHGIDGFCFYYYHFAGRKLLHAPIENFIKSKKNFPFFFLWANENWSKRWNGGDDDVIIEQNHSPEDDAIFIDDILPIFADPRYVRIEGKPLLMVYKVHLLKDALATTERWRRAAEQHGFPGLYLVMADDWTQAPPHPRSLGFDASYEIPSNIISEEALRDPSEIHGLDPDFEGRIVDYERFARFHATRAVPDYKRFKTVMVPWDNTARYGKRALIHVNGEGSAYRHWLTLALIDSARRYAPDEQIVLLHSWNEWCEGTYLEPDGKLRRFYLEQTAQAIATAQQAIAAAADNRDGSSLIAHMFEAMSFRDEVVFRFDATLAKMRARHLATIGEAERAERLLALTLQSRSWRLTAPLRALMRLLSSMIKPRM